jgi:hypothetical protein
VPGVGSPTCPEVLLWEVRCADALRSRLPGDRKLAPTRVEPRLVRPVWRINSTPTLPAASSSNANKSNGQRAFHGVAQLPLRILPAKYLILWHSKLYGSLAHKQMFSNRRAGGPKRHHDSSVNISTVLSSGDRAFLPSFVFGGFALAFSASARAWFNASRRRRTSLRAAGLMV